VHCLYRVRRMDLWLKKLESTDEPANG
jgi:hypothetical protein